MNIRSKEPRCAIFLPQELDHHVSARLREEADLMVETHFIRTIIFDFSGTDWMDSSGIGVILGRYKNMKLSGGHVYAVHLNERMQKNICDVRHGTLDGGGIKRMIQEKEKQSQAETQEQGENWMQIAFAAQSENEGFARTAVAAFVSCLDPTIDELADIKTAVSEAVTNCIIHGYNLKGGTIWLEASLSGRTLYVAVTDEGRGIRDIKQALEPLFTTRPDLERSGMGFSFMEAFMDVVEVESSPGKGTRVVMKKEIR